MGGKKELSRSQADAGDRDGAEGAHIHAVEPCGDTVLSATGPRAELERCVQRLEFYPYGMAVFMFKDKMKRLLSLANVGHWDWSRPTFVDAIPNSANRFDVCSQWTEFLAEATHPSDAYWTDERWLGFAADGADLSAR